VLGIQVSDRGEKTITARRASEMSAFDRATSGQARRMSANDPIATSAAWNLL
jgi:hypothetical protein